MKMHIDMQAGIGADHPAALRALEQAELDQNTDILMHAFYVAFDRACELPECHFATALRGPDNILAVLR